MPVDCVADGTVHLILHLNIFHTQKRTLQKGKHTQNSANYNNVDFSFYFGNELPNHWSANLCFIRHKKIKKTHPSEVCGRCCVTYTIENHRNDLCVHIRDARNSYARVSSPDFLYSKTFSQWPPRNHRPSLCHFATL